MAKRLSIGYGSLRQDTHDLPTIIYDPLTFNFGWVVEIHDRDFIGVGDIAGSIGNISSDGVTIKMVGGRSDMNKAIVPTVASFSMLINSAIEESFLTDLIAGDEERFHIKVYHRQELKFAGYILIDQITEDISESNRILNVKAVDGLSRMKEVKYKLDEYDVFEDLNYGFDKPSYPTFAEIIRRCMDETSIPDLYDAAHPLYNIYIDWYESKMGTVLDTSKPSVFDQVRCQNKLFYNLDESEDGQWEVNPKTKSRTMSCYKVLETILTLFHAKIFYEDGRYYIRHAFGSEQVNGDMRFVSYDKTMAPLDNGVTMNKTEPLGYLQADSLRLLKPSSIEYAAPHKYVEVAYQGLVENAINGYTWADNDNSWQSVNYFIVDEAVNIHLIFNHTAVYNNVNVIFTQQQWKFTTQVRIGAYYLQRIAGTVYKCEWVLDATASIEVGIDTVWGETSYQSLIEFTTDPIPIDGPMEVKLLNATHINSSGEENYRKGYFAGILVDYVAAAYVGTTASMTAGLISQNLASDDERLTIYRSGAINGNSRTKSIDILLGNDTDAVFDLSQLYMWEEDPITLANGKWFPYTNWADFSGVSVGNSYNPVPDWGGGFLIQQKLVESYAKTHTVTKKIISGSIDDVKNRISFNTVLSWNGDDYLPITLDHITSLDRYKGQWIEIGKTTTAVNVDLVFEPTRKTTPFSGSPNQTNFSELADTTSLARSGNLIHSRTYISALATVSILDHTIPSDIKTKYTRPSIDDSYILYVNGVRWKYVPTLLEVDKAGVFTLDPNTLNWNIWRATTSDVRLEVWDRLIVELNPII